MCGIAGIIKFDNVQVQEHELKSMMKRMKHRGPDDDGLIIDKNIGFGFVRLSIIDLSPSGHQPMTSNDGNLILVFNGEIYNYIELKKELGNNYTFKSKTDSEVILAAFKKWGKDCINHFNGMFAFAIFNKQTREVFCARDRFGIKPFYYYSDSEQFIFASEIPPILEVLPQKPLVNLVSIYDYLVYNRTDQTSNTFFEDISKLPHAHSISVQDRNVTLNKWYDLKEHLGNPFSGLDDFRESFNQSIRFRLRSDVPIGVCLSGGLDSSSIVSVLLKDFNFTDLKTFSAVFNKGEFGDESVFILEYRNSIRNMMFITPTADTLFEDKENFVRAHGEPVPSTSPYSQFKVMELAHGNVVVTLDGQGADEEFAGYHYFFGFYFKELFKQLRMMRLVSEVFNYSTKHGSLFGLKTFSYFLLPSIIKNQVRVKEKGYLNQDFVQEYASKNTIVDNLYNSTDLNDSLLNHFEYKLEHLLKWEDRNSMHFSIESRVPFLDHQFVEKALSLKSDQIINKGMTKYYLREAMNGILPETIRMRKDKLGFGTPQDNWFRTPRFQDYTRDLLHSNSFRELNFIKPEKADDLYTRHLERKINIGKEIWKWINLSIWHKTYIS